MEVLQALRGYIPVLGTAAILVGIFFYTEWQFRRRTRSRKDDERE